MSLIYVYKNRGISKDITIKDGRGVTIVPGSGDKIRVSIGHEGQLDTAPLLVISSAAATSNGSTFTPNSPSSGVNRLRVDDADAQLLNAGVYMAAFDLCDNADAGDWKNISRQVFVVSDT